jgi:hypothetical protein
MVLQHNNQPNQECNLPKAFVLGNGISRSGIDLNKLKNYGTVYGCNALYREFTPDHLIAVDTKMILEIVDANYHFKNLVWTNPNSTTNKISNLNLMNPHLGWSSGPTALHLASLHGYDEIYILGFDYVGLGTDTGLVNNLYADTKNYKKSNDRATYYGNWLRQTATCINQHQKVKYYRITNNSAFLPRELTELQNLFHMEKEKFLELFK